MRTVPFKTSLRLHGAPLEDRRSASEVNSTSRFPMVFADENGMPRMISTKETLK